MLDMLGILFSTVAVLVVIVRAVRFDRVQPWFQPLDPPTDAAGSPRGRTDAWRRS
jgi:hypothetical protein